MALLVYLTRQIQVTYLTSRRVIVRQTTKLPAKMLRQIYRSIELVGEFFQFRVVWFKGKCNTDAHETSP
ncbi:hypothetical protein H9L39_17398 [Fusarium oxysporum f. sp. albedinis]|nr:hypothetical protein H9L39_17398 [Fusarium oxysporum f. sp. albedinis]